jgi:transposase-like protein
MDFKIEAVRLLRESGKSLKEVAEDLGVSTNSLRERLDDPRLADAAADVPS